MHPRLKTDRETLPEILEQTLAHSLAFLQELDRRPAAVDPGELEPAALPERGVGALAALEQFQERYGPLLSASPGPRYLGFVTGGATPAAVAGDWLTAVYDQNAQLNRDTCAPFVEQEAIGFLRELFGLSTAFTGCFVSGATPSNLVGLATGRQHLARGLGIDAAEEGLWGAPHIPVLSGSAHSSVVKALAMLGMGRRSLRPVACLPGREAVDVAALEEQLQRLDGAPALVVANAGTVNSTDFDDLEALGRLKERYPFWLHVDGAFGLFAACSPHYRHLVAGVEAADSITVDGHKWLNVPYDSAVLFTRHLEEQIQVFQNVSPYLGSPDPQPHNFIHLVPENSRRFRALAAWMSLVAYGREGYREMVERDCALAAALAERLAASKTFRLLAPVRLNVVCFALRGAGDDPERTRDLVEHLRTDGRAFLTPTVYQGTPALRAAFSNWSTQAADLDLVFQALEEAAARVG